MPWSTLPKSWLAGVIVSVRRVSDRCRVNEALAVPPGDRRGLKAGALGPRLEVGANAASTVQLAPAAERLAVAVVGRLGELVAFAPVSAVAIVPARHATGIRDRERLRRRGRVVDVVAEVVRARRDRQVGRRCARAAEGRRAVPPGVADA